MNCGAGTWNISERSLCGQGGVGLEAVPGRGCSSPRQDLERPVAVSLGSAATVRWDVLLLTESPEKGAQGLSVPGTREVPESACRVNERAAEHSGHVSTQGALLQPCVTSLSATSQSTETAQEGVGNRNTLVLWMGKLRHRAVMSPAQPGAAELQGGCLGACPAQLPPLTGWRGS